MKKLFPFANSAAGSSSRESVWLAACLVLSLAIHAALLQWLPAFRHMQPCESRPDVLQVRLMPRFSLSAPTGMAEDTKPVPRKMAHHPPREAPIISRQTDLSERTDVTSSGIPSRSESPEPANSPGEATPIEPQASQKAAESLPITLPEYRAAYLDNPRPPYPLAARRLGLEGKVVLRAEVLESGVCNRLVVKSSSGHDILDQAALRAVKQWRFIPARRGSEAMDGWVEIPVVFSLTS